VEAALDVLSWILLIGGSFFCVVGAIGLLRFPEFYARLHAAGVTDTLGASLIIFGLAIQAGWTLVMVKLGFILFFIYMTSPTAGHALAKTAYKAGLRPVLDREEDES
jgi:multicomponent Na+:H+ antiporter subunit G